MGRGGGGGGMGGFGLGGRSVGLGSVVLAVIAGWIFGINPLTLLGLAGGGGTAPAEQTAPPATVTSRHAFASTMVCSMYARTFGNPAK